MAGYRKTLAPDKRRLIEQYRGVDAAVKVVGVGSVGTRAFIIVMEGANHDDPLVLQVKEARNQYLSASAGKAQLCSMDSVLSKDNAPCKQLRTCFWVGVV